MIRHAALTVLLACNGGSLNTGTDTAPAGTTPGTNPTNPGPGQGQLYVAITSPADGASVQEGQEVTLSAAATDAYGASTQASMQWSAPGWTAQGNNVAVSDLPSGSYDLTVTATSGSNTASDRVSLEVQEQPAGPVDYEGVLDMLAVLDLGAWGVYDEPCVHEYLYLTIEAGSLTGEGACTVDSGFSVDTYVFELSGTSDGTTISGEMVSDLADGKGLAFYGTIDAAGHIEASYDETWDSPDGSLQLVGTLWADPV